MISGQVINFDRLLRRRDYLFHVEDLRELFTNAAYGEGFERRQMLLVHKPTSGNKNCSNECCKSSCRLPKNSFVRFNMAQNVCFVQMFNN